MIVQNESVRTVPRDSFRLLSAALGAEVTGVAGVAVGAGPGVIGSGLCIICAGSLVSSGRVEVGRICFFGLFDFLQGFGIFVGREIEVDVLCWILRLCRPVKAAVSTGSRKS